MSKIAKMLYKVLRKCYLHLFVKKHENNICKKFDTMMQLSWLKKRLNSSKDTN